MIRRWLLGGLSAFALLTLLCPSWAAAQIVPFPKIQFPNGDGLPEELQQQLEELQRQLQQALDPNALQQGRNLPGNASTVKWGGLRVKKVPADLQEKLGLPETEGLQVMAVDPNSVTVKAGLKSSDVLVKINNQSVPNDLTGFAKLVKEQKPTDPVDLVVVRNGKEETIKGVRMPVVTHAAPIGGVRPGLPGFGGLMIPRININPNFPAFPVPQQGAVQNLQLEMTVNGAKISKKQTADQFSGTYAKDELTISVKGKIENGLPKIGEISVQEGKDTKTFTKLGEVPLQHRVVIQRMLRPPNNSTLTFPLQGLPIIPNFPGFPQIPGLDDE